MARGEEKKNHCTIDWCGVKVKSGKPLIGSNALKKKKSREGVLGAGVGVNNKRMCNKLWGWWGWWSDDDNDVVVRISMNQFHCDR